MAEYPLNEVDNWMEETCAKENYEQELIQGINRMNPGRETCSDEI